MSKSSSSNTVFLQQEKKIKILVQAKLLPKWVDIIDKFAAERGFSRSGCIELLLENCAKEIVDGRIT